MYNFESGSDTPQPVEDVKAETRLIKEVFGTTAGAELLAMWKKGLIARMAYSRDTHQQAYSSGWSDAIRSIIKHAEAGETE